jgi:hypothetical protein
VPERAHFSISDAMPGKLGERERKTHDADFLQFAYEVRLHLAIEYVLDRHADENLAGTDQVHYDAEAVERAEYAGEEAVGDALPVRLHVQHDDALLDRNRGRETLEQHPPRGAGAIGGSVAECPGNEGHTEAKAILKRHRRLEIRFRIDDSASAARIFDVLDAYGDFSADDLVMPIDK